MIAIRLLVLFSTLFDFGFSLHIVDAPIFGKQYFLGDAPKNFADSRAYCASHGGQLVRVDYIGDEGFVKKMARDKYGSTNVGVNAEKVKGRYVWPNGDEARPSSSWYSGYPNCAAQCCRLIMLASGQWYDQTCDHAVHFVCELTNLNQNGVEEGPLNLPSRGFRNWTITEIENLKADDVEIGRMINSQARDNEKLSKYFLTDEVYNISAAKEFCELHKGHMAIVGSQWEEALIGFVKRDSKPWIGLESVNGTYKWLGKHDIEYANWNSEATLHTLEELLQMQTDVPDNLSQIERLALLNRISEQFARYRNKWGVEVVDCMAVYMESDGTWNVDRCSALRYGVCERKSWMETKTATLMQNEISELKTRLEEQQSRLEDQTRETHLQIAQLFSQLNDLKKSAKSD